MCHCSLQLCDSLLKSVQFCCVSDIFTSLWSLFPSAMWWHLWPTRFCWVSEVFRCPWTSVTFSNLMTSIICLILMCFRCIHKSVDPCSLQLCEQRCSVYLQKVVCTCFPGYRFNAEKQKQGLKPVCEGKPLIMQTKTRHLNSYKIQGFHGSKDSCDGLLGYAPRCSLVIC
jgi:hypothetical protein